MSETESRPRRRGKPAEYDDDVVIVEVVPVDREWAEEQDWIDVQQVEPGYKSWLYTLHDYETRDGETCEDFVVWSDSANTCGVVDEGEMDYVEKARGVYDVQLLKKGLELAEFAGWQHIQLQITEQKHAPDVNGILLQDAVEESATVAVAGRKQDGDIDD